MQANFASCCTFIHCQVGGLDGLENLHIILLSIHIIIDNKYYC